MRTADVFPTIEKKRNRTRGITEGGGAPKEGKCTTKGGG